MPKLEEIRERLLDHEPEVVGREDLSQAAVALVLRDAQHGAEVLLIERARRAGDPWSGHMALPGGRVEPGDITIRDTAERETFEEVGVDLRAAEHLGLLAELQGNPRFRQHQLVVSAHVYHVPDPDPFVLETREVHDALWFPVADLLDPSRHVEYRTERGPYSRLPGILVGVPDRQVVWGLTYRFLDIFLRAIGRPLPDRWQALGEFRLED